MIVLHFPSWRVSRVPKERAETFLFEVAVIGEGFGNSVAAHRLHRNTIDQAVLLIRSLLVNSRPSRKDSLLWGTTSTSGSLRSSCGAGGATAQPSILREEREKLAQHLIRGHNGRVGECAINRNGILIPRVRRIRESNPIKRVGKDRVH
jgi:hypothetical protein